MLKAKCFAAIEMISLFALTKKLWWYSVCHTQGRRVWMGPDVYRKCPNNNTIKHWCISLNLNTSPSHPGACFLINRSPQSPSLLPSTTMLAEILESMWFCSQRCNRSSIVTCQCIYASGFSMRHLIWILCDKGSCIGSSVPMILIS